jgi:predicted restriction endonuclease
LKGLVLLATFVDSAWGAVMTWREAVWAAVQRQASVEGVVTRQQLIEKELNNIKAEVGSLGLTPEQTLTRVLIELRKDGVLLTDDSRGRYRIAEGVAEEPLETAVATEQWKLQKTRIGQGRFRKALLDRWDARCPITGVTEPSLLLASHIVPWNRCESDAERVNPENGLLLSALWDAAFDGGLVSFADDGAAIPSPELSRTTFKLLCGGGPAVLHGLTVENRERLGWHRAEYRLGT